MGARYWVAQYVSDLFRNEPRNVGVFVEADGLVASRFFGEVDGQLDGRKLRAFQYPDVYRQWVAYWRTQGHGEGLRAVLKSSGSHYRLAEGGSVEDANAADVANVADYLFSVLVSEGGFGEAIGSTAEKIELAPTASLTQEVVDAFKQDAVLDSSDLYVAHPVRREVALNGVIGIAHRPAFVQENGRLYVMEVVDFTGPRKKLARDHAGWSAYMFSDIKRARETSAIAVVRLAEEDARDAEVENGLGLLRHEASIVNWLDAEQRLAFLRERRQIAVTG
jgi:hypothetical protein